MPAVFNLLHWMHGTLQIVELPVIQESTGMH